MPAWLVLRLGTVLFRLSLFVDPSWGLMGLCEAGGMRQVSPLLLCALACYFWLEGDSQGDGGQVPP